MLNFFRNLRLPTEPPVRMEKPPVKKNWLVWSIEHDAWWAENERGYIRSRKKAGRYTYERALEIVKRANCRNGDTPFEAMVEDVDDDAVAKEMGRV